MAGFVILTLISGGGTLTVVGWCKRYLKPVSPPDCRASHFCLGFVLRYRACLPSSVAHEAISVDGPTGLRPSELSQSATSRVRAHQANRPAILKIGTGVVWSATAR